MSDHAQPTTASPTGDAGLHPQEGARFLFERASQSDDRGEAVYRAAIATPEQRFDYRITMRIDGSCERAAADTGAGEGAGGGARAPEDLEAKLDTIARLIARGAAGKQRDELPPWPHRVLRWRGPGRG